LLCPADEEAEGEEEEEQGRCKVEEGEDKEAKAERLVEERKKRLNGTGMYEYCGFSQTSQKLREGCCAAQGDICPC
jgi:hypothetical protein